MKMMHTKLHTKNKSNAKRCVDKSALRLEAPQAAILAGTKDGVRRKCEKRLLKINYPGAGNNSQFTYDGFGHCVQIVETSSGTIVSTKQLVWCHRRMCEARNASGTITAQYFGYGQTISGTSYFYTIDWPPGSVREVTDNSGNTQAAYSYDPYGRVTKLQGALSSDFQYAGYYFHAPSGLSLTGNRAYSANLGRWINRDPIGETGGLNLYAYVSNEPIGLNDPFGLCPLIPPPTPPQFCSADDFICDCADYCAKDLSGMQQGCMTRCLNGFRTAPSPNPGDWRGPSPSTYPNPGDFMNDWEPVYKRIYGVAPGFQQN